MKGACRSIEHLYDGVSILYGRQLWQNSICIPWQMNTFIPMEATLWKSFLFYSGPAIIVLNFLFWTNFKLQNQTCFMRYKKGEKKCW